MSIETIRLFFPEEDGAAMTSLDGLDGRCPVGDWRTETRPLSGTAPIAKLICLEGATPRAAAHRQQMRRPSSSSPEETSIWSVSMDNSQHDSPPHLECTWHELATYRAQPLQARNRRLEPCCPFYPPLAIHECTVAPVLLNSQMQS